MVSYSFNEDNEFVIEDYDRAKPFAGFLPGIAGVDGIPMWSFYVNRGQVMGSFGIKDKNNAIMEFFPAAVMYRTTEYQGFRTFIKKDGGIHEIFSFFSEDDAVRKLFIGKNRIRIVEDNLTLGIKVTVTYFTMPGENYAALVRKAEFENTLGSGFDIEILDGLPQILPTGVSNSEYQAMSNLMRAWFDVYNLENDIAYYKIRGSVADTAEVTEFTEGNFYLSFSSESGVLIPPIIDMNVIFGENTALTRPDGWDASAGELHKKRQAPQNKASGGFSGVKTRLSDKFTLCTVIGHASSMEIINGRKNEYTLNYINMKEKEAVSMAERLVSDTFTKTSDGLFDQYIAQCMLDNLLRGGYPLIFKAEGRNLVYHVFSRKHGDTEREYNFFTLEPAFYSQGNGNYRDVSQNRRIDVLIKPEVEDFDIKHFMSLIQVDGYNPLTVKGCFFTVDSKAIPELVKPLQTHKAEVGRILEGKFTPGKLATYLKKNKVSMEGTEEDFLEKILARSIQSFEAEFGEGYWSDHWTYNMDLVDAYLSVYPEKKETLLFGDKTYRFFHSDAYVLSRSDKYVLAKGAVRQYGAVQKGSHSREGLNETQWLKTKNGAGEIYETDLFSKLLSLALIKFVSLDPCGMGIEMEAGKPGWNDAMNGLPGLFGSGLSETAELRRILGFLLEASEEYDREAYLYIEAALLMEEAEKLLDMNLSGRLSDFSYWDLTSSLREAYRAGVRYGIDGTVKKIMASDLRRMFMKMDSKLEIGLEKALAFGKGIYPTYFTYEAVKYEVIEGKTNPVNGYQNVRVTEFACKALPLFLEAPSRIIKTMKDCGKALQLYDAIKASGMYDAKLKMYKTSESLEDASAEVGRLRAFTPGWLEREAVFMHMEYKYLYALLKAGLYSQFFGDAFTMLVPFMDPAVYGRSTLENSSFIASSANPDEAVHGRGFVARLTGTTAEMLSIWYTMMTGGEAFRFENGELGLSLAPILPGRLFDRDGRVSFKFLGRTTITYINPGMRDTFGENGVKPVKYILSDTAKAELEINGPVIGAPYAEAARNGSIGRIVVYLE